MNSEATTVRLALTAADPVAMGAIRLLASLTVAGWRSLDTDTRALADAFIAINLAATFSPRGQPAPR